MKAEEVPEEWVEAGARALYPEAWDDARWGSADGKPQEIAQEEASKAAAAVLAAVIPQLKAAALREWAEQVRAAYPEDIFIPLTPARLVEVHLYLAGRGGTLDALSAHLMRDAARLVDDEADRIERGES